MQPLSYQSTGVNYDVLDKFKLACQRAAGKTVDLLAAHEVSEPAGIRGESAYLIETPEEYLAHVEEGLGTKNLVADALLSLHPARGADGYFNIGIDTVAAIVNDLLTVGALPMVVAMHAAVGSATWFENEKRAKALADGFAEGCRRAGAVWGGGETPTLSGVVEPGTVVLLAAGAWSRALARMAGHELPVRPVRGWIALVAPGPPVLRHAVYEAEYTAPEPPVPGGPVTLADLAEGTVAEAGPPPVHALGIHQNADGTVVVGASRSAALHEGAESLAGLRGNARRACAMVPGIADREVAATWTGLRPFSHDGLPYIGVLDDGLAVCAGHGAEGILTGAGSGRLAAELVLGREPYTDVTPFRPDR